MYLVCRLLLSAAPPTCTLPLHDALPISQRGPSPRRTERTLRSCRASDERTATSRRADHRGGVCREVDRPPSVSVRTARTRRDRDIEPHPDRKSTRLNSSHRCISYAVFCFLPPRRLAPFPYTTLFRSPSAAHRRAERKELSVLVEHLMSERQHRVEQIIEVASVGRSIVLHQLASEPRERVATGISSRIQIGRAHV